MALDTDDWTQNIPPYGDEQPAPRLSVVSRTDEQAAAADELPEPTPAVDIPTVDVAGVLSNPSPPPDFVWAGRVPAGHVCLLSGHGGSGKSTLALQLAAAVATGRPLLGCDTTKGRALVFSGEDAAPLLRHRLADICRAMDISPPVLAENLTVLDASAEPVLHQELAEFGRHTVEPTPIFHRLAEIVDEQQPTLLIIDNASDTFAGSENDRAQVRSFVRSLAKLARETASHPAIVLLTHTPKASVGGRGESYSGSTAWHNSARARLSMTPDKDDAAAVVLTLDKLNLAPTTAPALRLTRSHGGVLVLDESTRDAAGEPTEPPQTAVLRVLADFVRRGERVSAEPNSPRTNAWALLRQEPNFPRRMYTVAGTLFAAFRQMERDGLVEREQYRNQSRKDRTSWILSAKGWGAIGEVAPSAPSAPTPEVGTLGTLDASRSAPSAPTPCARGVGVESAHTLGASSDNPTLAETGTRADGTNPRAKGRRTRKGADQ